ncbi:MAG: hypothetical protein HYS12_16320 [Planctomycetes bacterium]|nr:hypothetical protein [Planctomycetota bacterium]
MRVHLARDPETRTVQVTLPVPPLPGRARGGKGIFYVRPGEQFGPYSHQELWDLGSGMHELADPPLEEKLPAASARPPEESAGGG